VPGVGDESALPVTRTRQRVHHGVEAAGQIADLICGVDAGPADQAEWGQFIGLGDPGDGSGQLAQRGHQPASGDIAHHRAEHDQRRPGDRDQRPDVAQGGQGGLERTCQHDRVASGFGTQRHCHHAIGHLVGADDRTRRTAQLGSGDRDFLIARVDVVAHALHARHCPVGAHQQNGDVRGLQGGRVHSAEALDIGADRPGRVAGYLEEFLVELAVHRAARSEVGGHADAEGGQGNADGGEIGQPHLQRVALLVPQQIVEPADHGAVSRRT